MLNSENSFIGGRNPKKPENWERIKQDMDYRFMPFYFIKRITIAWNTFILLPIHRTMVDLCHLDGPCHKVDRRSGVYSDGC